jgi:hypothetical protein
MSSISQVESIITAAAARYAAALNAFRPWISTYQRNNVIAERNISFYIANEFCSENKSGHAFMEREFRQSTDGHTSSLKLDTYCTSPDLAMLIEVKVLVDIPYASGVAKDFDRVTEEVANQQRNLHVGDKPRTTHGVVVAETWKKDPRDWWAGRTPTKTFSKVATARLQHARDNGWHFKEHLVGNLAHGSTAPAAGQQCYWLYAITPPFHNAA